MARTPEQPDDSERHDRDHSFDDADFSMFPNVSPRTQKIIFTSVAALAITGFYMANRLNPTKPPHVAAKLISADQQSSSVHVTTPQGENLDVASNTRVEATCYDMKGNNSLGEYRFVIDEGLYNGRVAQTDRGHLYTTGDPWPPTEISRPSDPFNGLPLC